MEVVAKKNEVIVKVKENGSGKKSWLRVLTSVDASGFADKVRTRSSKGSLIDSYKLINGVVFQVCDGSDRAYYKLDAGYLTELKSFEIHKHFPAKKKVKITIEYDLEDQDLITKLLNSLK